MLCWSERNEWGYGPRRVTQAEIHESFAEGWTVESIEDDAFETNVATGRSTPGWPASPVRSPAGGPPPRPFPGRKAGSEV